MVEKANSLEELLEDCPKNQVIGDNLIRAWAKINSPKYKKIVCSISGGSDSDIMLDIVWRCDKNNKVDYVWFDTGLEYQATKDHLKYLENKYKIDIIPYRPKKPIPIACRDCGQPFISKYVSRMIYLLQGHNFKWEDKSFEELYKKYPNNKIALNWWTNNSGEGSRFNISQNKWLKEFMVQNPPNFKISNRCCDYAKKNIVHNILKEGNYDLNITGIRKAEGGVRSYRFKSCFDDNDDKHDNYRPLFWYTNQDKIEYEIAFDIKHSKCYSEYGLYRTGCAGCPFGREFEFELRVIQSHEPKLSKAVNNIFRESYEYTRKYREFYQIMNEKEKQLKI